MVTLASLIQLYGADEGNRHYTYLDNKNRGGNNNAKGNAFENFFAVYKIAELLNRGADKKSTFISAQGKYYVDDLIIEDIKLNTANYFQIKDIAALTWQTGDNFTLENNVFAQHNFNVQVPIITTCIIVVSRPDVAKSLLNTLPATISQYSSVVYFSTALTVNALLQTNKDFKKEIQELCALSNPSPDKLEAVAVNILGVWDAVAKGIPQSLGGILERSRKAGCNFIKGTAGQLIKEIEEILNAIDNLFYTLENGFLTWQYDITDSGTFPYAMGTLEFTQWESDIINLKPVTFEDLEPYLS